MSYGKQERKDKTSTEEKFSKEDFKRNSGRSRRGKRSGNRNKGAMPERSASGVCDTLHNDPSWYEPFSGSTELVARQSFGKPLGTPVRLRDFGAFDGVDDEAYGFSAFPGIMRINYITTPGISTLGDRSSAVNTMSQGYYTTVRYAQRGSGTYDDSDLTIGALGIFSLYEYWAFMRRIYGVLNMYSVSNKYLAHNLFVAMGGDFDNFQKHIYDFQGYINKFALKMSQFCIPADFHIIDRRVRLASNIYVDGTSTKAQMYFYQPAWFWKYDELTNAAGTQLVPVTLPEEFTFSDVVDFGNDLINALRDSSTLMNMCGDVLNAYGAENMKHITAISEDYLVPILYDEEMVMEIQNTTMIGEVAPESCKLYADADTNTIVSTIAYENGMQSRPSFTEALLNMRNDAPTAQQVMRATRLMAFWHINEANQSVVSTCGTEVATTAEIFYIHVANGVEEVRKVNFQTLTPLNTWSAVQTSVMEKFDYHPYLYLFEQDEDTSAFILRGITGDVENIITMPEETVASINEYALLGLLKTKKMDLFFTK